MLLPVVADHVAYQDLSIRPSLSRSSSGPLRPNARMRSVRRPAALTTNDVCVLVVKPVRAVAVMGLRA